MDFNDTEVLNRRLDGCTAEEIILWSLENLGPEIAAGSSFLTQSVPLLHILSRLAPEIPVIFIDTGFHSPETLQYRDQLVDLLGLNLRVVDIADLDSESVELIGIDFDDTQPSDGYAPMRLNTMRKDIRGLSCLLSGLRRDQPESGPQLRIFEPHTGGTVKVYPFLNWFRSDAVNYIKWHGLPMHPLYEPSLNRYRKQTVDLSFA